MVIWNGSTTVKSPLVPATAVPSSTETVTSVSPSGMGRPMLPPNPAKVAVTSTERAAPSDTEPSTLNSTARRHSETGANQLANGP